MDISKSISFKKTNNKNEKLQDLKREFKGMKLKLQRSESNNQLRNRLEFEDTYKNGFFSSINLKKSMENFKNRNDGKSLNSNKNFNSGKFNLPLLSSFKKERDLFNELNENNEHLNI